MLVDAAFASRRAPASRLMLPSASLADTTTEAPALLDAVLLESFKVPSLDFTATSLENVKEGKTLERELSNLANRRFIQFPFS